MGAWGSAAFENDDALDWVWELEESTDDAVVRAALTVALDAEELEAPEASCALAAAEVVAAAGGAPVSSLPDGVRAWVAAHELPADLRGLAREAVTRIAERSELRQLWDEAGGDDWRDGVSALQARLA
jgi:poly-gamma-glutamate capsule biosynthesis protein CapA/YwtB (metallophosphatase superfamily)